MNVPLKNLDKSGYLQELTQEQSRHTTFPVAKAHWAKLIKDFGALKSQTPLVVIAAAKELPNPEQVDRSQVLHCIRNIEASYEAQDGKRLRDDMLVTLQKLMHGYNKSMVNLKEEIEVDPDA